MQRGCSVGIAESASVTTAGCPPDSGLAQSIAGAAETFIARCHWSASSDAAGVALHAPECASNWLGAVKIGLNGIQRESKSKAALEFAAWASDVLDARTEF